MVAAHRVGIVYPWSNLDTVPSLCSAVDLLAEAGYRVDVYTKAGPDFVVPTFDHDGVEVLVDRPRQQRRGIHRLLPARWSTPLRAWQRHLACPYRCVIAVDPQGLFAARSLLRLTRIPVAYLSLEVLLIDETSTPRHHLWKQVEAEMGRRAPFVVVQDEARAELLCAAAGIDRRKVLLVPNAPQGPGRRRRRDYWHRRFDLAEDRRVVLHAGSVYHWTGIEGIVASAHSWPADWVLVVHTRFHAPRDSAIIDKLRTLAEPEPGASQRVFFSLSPVSRQEYDELIDSAEAGIAFYEPESDSLRQGAKDNVRIIGFSSGKLSYYLRAGLPVIVNDAASIGELIEGERCGTAVASAGGIAAALSAISRDYQGYSARAIEVFDRHLDFTRGFEAVIQHIQQLGEGTK